MSDEVKKKVDNILEGKGVRETISEGEKLDEEVSAFHLNNLEDIFYEAAQMVDDAKHEVPSGLDGEDLDKLSKLFREMEASLKGIKKKTQ